MLFTPVLRLLLFPLRMRYSAGPPPTGAATTAPHLQEDLMERAVPTPPTTVRGWAHVVRRSVFRVVVFVVFFVGLESAHGPEF